MKEESLSPSGAVAGHRKRKWSPSGSDSGSTIKNEYPASRSPDVYLSDDNTAAEGGSLVANTLRKRTRLSNSKGPVSSALVQAPVHTKVPDDRSRLPRELWQYVFNFLPPTALGRLLQVNRSFNDLLTPDKTLSPATTYGIGRLLVQNKEHLWLNARKFFFPGLPRPLSGMTELELWRFLRGRSCRYCGKKPPTALQRMAAVPWSSGPGPENVRIIWPFAIRACGSCLRMRLRKETDLLFSSSSALIPALPFAFFTPSLHFVASLTLRNTPVPTGLQLTKYYFEPQIEEVKKEMAEVLRMGNATAQEWYKGLEERGRAKMADASRWEQWELSGGFQSVLPSHDIPTSNPRGNVERSESVAVSVDEVPGTLYNGGTKTSMSNGSAGLCPPTATSLRQVLPPSLPSKPAIPASHFQYNQNLALPPQIPAPKPIQPHVPQPRMERSMRDVTEMKANRRAEIERRCLQLDTPIMASTLVHMDSFAAAIQIPMALNDNAWEVLKPRLLAQREVAEGREQEQRAASQLLHAKTEERRQQEAQLKEAREALDREWEEKQRPVHDKIDAFADEIIRDGWRDGQAVNNETCVQFAADVLVYVYRRFFDVLAQEDATTRPRGVRIPTDSPDGSSARKLTLENMKWVYEAKIKPFTERHRKELFLCNACGNHSKYYALDAVIQHFAAKHTSALSMGTAVVYWRAEWPAEQPFNPNPSIARAVPVHPNPTSSVRTSIGYGISPEHMQYNTSNQTTARSPLPTHVYIDGGPGLGGPHFQAAAYSLSQQTDDSCYNARGGYWQHHLTTPAPQISPAFAPYTSHGYAAPQPITDQRSSLFSSSVGRGHTNTPLAQSSPLQPAKDRGRPFQAGPPGQPFGIYQVQVEDLAKNAREIWDGTSGIRDLPSSFRIQVIINHVILRFTQKYTNEPNLALFTDGLNKNSLMKPIRELGGLTCKSCATTPRQLNSHEFFSQSLPNGTALYTIPALLAHFQSVHVEHGQPNVMPQTGIELPRLDWKFDMVELPGRSAISNLMRSPGITFSKLNLIATVLPSYFPTPLPKIGTIPDAGVEAQEEAEEYNPRYGFDVRSNHTVLSHRPPRDGRASRHSFPSRRRNDGLEVVVDDLPNFVDLASRIVEPAGEDEYDPHRPSYLQLDRGDIRNPAYAVQQGQERSAVSSRTLLREKENLGSPVNLSPHAITETAASFEKRPLSSRGYPRQLLRSLPPDDASAGRSYSGRHLAHQDSTDEVLEIYPSRRPAKLSVGGGGILDTPRFTVHATKTTTPMESTNAAEQFLNSFDPSADQEAYTTRDTARRKPTHDTLQGSYQADAFSTKSAGTAQRGRDDSPWQSYVVESSIDASSPRGSPNGTRSTMPRSPVIFGHYALDATVVYNDRTSEPERYRRRIREFSPGLPKHIRPHEDRSQHGVRYIQDMPRGRPDGRYGPLNPLNESQLVHYPPREGSPNILEQLSTETVYNGDHSVEPRQYERRIHAPQSPEVYRYQEQFEEPVAYSRLPSSRQSHYADDKRYIETTYGEPVGYVRVGTREPNAHERYYYAERSAPRELSNQYVGYCSDLRQEPVFEHNGQLYTRGRA